MQQTLLETTHTSHFTPCAHATSEAVHAWMCEVVHCRGARRIPHSTVSSAPRGLPARDSRRGLPLSRQRVPDIPPPMSNLEFAGVSVPALANVYFDGKVVSHTLKFGDGSKKTLGVVFAGEYHFTTSSAERMQITDGVCQVRLDGDDHMQRFEAGSHFDVPANSGFTIAVDEGLAQYICSYI